MLLFKKKLNSQFKKISFKINSTASLFFLTLISYLSFLCSSPLRKKVTKRSIHFETIFYMIKLNSLCYKDRLEKLTEVDYKLPSTSVINKSVVISIID